MNEKASREEASHRFVLGLLAVLSTVAVALGVVAGDKPTIAAGGRPQVDPGGAHTCAVSRDGQLFCWGWNFHGQVGDGTLESPLEPASIGLSDVHRVALGGNHTCALLFDMTLRCWGLNDHGQLGDGTTESTTVPGPPFMEDVRAIAAGSSHTCAVQGLEAVSIVCWGDDSQGQLSDGSMKPRLLPPIVCITTPCIPPNTTSLAAGANHNCTLDADNGIQCWGSNEFGQLGDGGACGEVCETPVQVCLPSFLDSCLVAEGIASITAGGAHTCAVTVDRFAYCWGLNGDGQLGDGTESDSSVPVQVCTEFDIECPVGSVLTSPIAIAAGLNHTCALSESRKVSCWGINSVSQLGNGSGDSSSLPLRVDGLDDDIATLNAGSSHTCTVAASGAMQCWGWNADGRLGDGTFTGRDGPVDVIGFGAKTPSPTPEPTTPTTPMPATATLTAGPPTPSATPSAEVPGDANCNGAVTSVDAALVLQFVAGLLEVLSCAGADANADGIVDSIDAALILQLVAGLLLSSQL